MKKFETSSLWRWIYDGIAHGTIATMKRRILMVRDPVGNVGRGSREMFRGGQSWQSAAMASEPEDDSEHETTPRRLMTLR